MTSDEARPVDAQHVTYFQARTIDDAPELLEKSYSLRYQVYCLERKFLSAEDYPEGREIDEFDRYSVHVGAVDARGELAGTARAVQINQLGLPLFRHCATFPDETGFRAAASRTVEVGRLSVSRAYRRRLDDDSYGLKGGPQPDSLKSGRGAMRRGRADVFLTLLKALYQATKRMGATHWLAAMEKSLERLLAQQGFPFRLIGPEGDYFGVIEPYQMDLREFEEVIVSRRFPLLDQFVVGLESELTPQVDQDGRLVRFIPSAVDRFIGELGESRRDGVDAREAVFGLETEGRLLREFRRAAADVPAYRALLDESRVAIDQVRDLTSFSRSCPLLSKSNTFNRFPLDELSVGGALVDVADVLTSSGHGGRFSFGVINRTQAAASAQFMDQAFDDTFGVKSRRTLAINCLPMGVIFSSLRMTVATTSVREDMAVALVETFGRYYDQTVLVGDPLFMKRLADHARARSLDWGRYTVHVVIGEEVFGEHFREYLSSCLGLNADDPTRGYIMSSFGVGELGLHLCYETPATIGLRRAAFAHPSFARELFGAGIEEGIPLPMIFSFDPLRTFIEVVDPDDSGYGRMTTSMLDPQRTVPLLRYQTGDIVRLIDRSRVVDEASRHGVTLAPDLPRTLLALRGRASEALSNGSHVAIYKDALYADHEIAHHVTGAFRMTIAGARCTMHVQMVLEPPTQTHASLERGILNAIPFRVRPDDIVLWPYAQFPFGMSLDYQRKFCHYVAADEGAATPPVTPSTMCEFPV